MKPVSMLEDARQIRMVNDDIGGQNIFVVGAHGITSIVCYGEPVGEGVVPWLAIYKGDAITARMAVRDVTLYYAESSEGVSKP